MRAMKIELRPYQDTSVKRLAACLPEARRIVAVAPTGAGKTAIGVAAAKRLRARRVVWLAHRFELLGQTDKALRDAGVPATEIGWLAGRRKENAGATYTLASIDMPPEKLQAVLHGADLVVIDEAHRALADSYRRALTLAPGALVIGLTATPWRLDGRGLDGVFTVLHVCATQTELIADGFLAHPITYGVSRADARALVKGASTTAGDFAPGEMGERMSKRELLGRVVAEWERLAKGRSTIVFAATREHAKKLHKQFKAAGHAFEYLDGETPGPERDAILARLAKKEIAGVVNVDVLIEGFDCPGVKCVVLARPTKSLTRYLQQVGRAARPHGRQRPIVIDHAGNTWRFGLPEAEREWTLADAPRGSGDAPVRHCPVCAAMISAGCLECPECGEVLGEDVAPRVLEEREAELKQLQAREAEKAAAYARIKAVAKDRGAPRGWAEKVLQEMFS
jgi:DNA repair protein RadD